MKIRVNPRLSASYFGLFLLLAACGGERVTPTPVPASIVRPAQPAPVYGKSSTFALSTPQPITITADLSTPLAQAEPITTTQPLTLSALRPTLSMLEQPPSAIGIATGDAILVERPSGRVMVNLPSGTAVTVTGKSADQRYWAAYTNDGVAGWVAIGQLLLFGGDDLIVVQTATGPGLIATLIAQDMQPFTATLATPIPTLSH